MFMYSLAERLDPNKVVINMMCPGMVNTSISDVLPLYLRLPFNVVKAIAARSVEVGAWLVLHTVLVAGPESHGRFLNDKTIAA
jgi:NAD(P)-dependent dehydrogenase (short-subunit alcohol dehydrogenase family)